MNSENLINDVVAKSDDIGTILSEFALGLRKLPTCSILQDHCVKFINICTGLGGSIRLAAIKLQEDWVAVGMELKTYDE